MNLQTPLQSVLLLFLFSLQNTVPDRRDPSRLAERLVELDPTQHHRAQKKHHLAPRPTVRFETERDVQVLQKKSVGNRGVTGIEPVTSRSIFNIVMRHE